MIDVWSIEDVHQLFIGKRGCDYYIHFGEKHKHFGPEHRLILSFFVTTKPKKENL